ncbi:MAG: hypothetical protein QXD60_02985 [Nanopusillaceae archaeon]
MLRLRYKGLVAHADALVAVESGDHLVPWLVSLLGPREAVRGIGAALAAGEKVYAHLPEAPPRLLVRSYFQEARLRHAPLGQGVHHLVYHSRGLGEEFYFARYPDPQREALWLSRRLGFPVPPDWLPSLEERLALPAWGGRALRALREDEYLDLLKERFPRG